MRMIAHVQCSIMTAAVLALLLLGGTIFAQPPRLISKVEPDYPEEARRLGVTATVVVGVWIGADGSPQNMKSIRPVGFGLDEKALQAVAKWRFEPGKKDGDKGAAYTTIEMNFSTTEGIRARIEWQPEGAQRPIAISGHFPRYKPPKPITFHVTFEVNQNGEVENLIGGDAAPEPMLDEIRKIRFQPATLGGKPIRSSAKLELSY